MHMKILNHTLLFTCALLIWSCDRSVNAQETPAPVKELTDEELLDMVESTHLDYMWTGAEPASGMAYERIHLDGNYDGMDPSIVTTGGTGFGIAGILVGMERGWITRQDGVARLQKIVDHLAAADRFHGVWPHWLNGATGKVVPFGTKDNGGDLVETSFLLEGLLCARQYMNKENEAEKRVAESIDELWKAVEFDWYTRDGKNVLYWHWSPNYQWEMNMPIRGYNECLIAYVLAASSPTHAVGKKCYEKGWARDGAIRSSAAPYGYPLDLSHNGAEESGGPLFWAHYSWIGLCPKGLKDQYADYWHVTANHALSDYAYCVQNPKHYTGYGANCWGLTASYSPEPVWYAAHAPNNDLGVITPTAALSSFPYTPEQSMAALRNFYSKKAWLWGKYGFYDAFSLNPSWAPQRYLAIDQLTIAPMIENYRTGLLWKLFMSCPEIQEGLTKLGFTYTINGK